MTYFGAVYGDILERAKTDLARNDVVSLRETLRQARNVDKNFAEKLMDEIYHLILNRTVATNITTIQLNDIAGQV